MGKIQDVVEKRRNGVRTKSILEDLGKPENSLKFSEESSRVIHEVGNIEWYELGQMTRFVQCHSCWKHLPEGLAFCSCGVCLRLDEATIRRIKARFQALTVPYYLARINRSRGKKHGETQWQRGILPIPGLPHDDQHLVHRTLASEAPVREHHHVGMQR